MKIREGFVSNSSSSSFIVISPSNLDMEYINKLRRAYENQPLIVDGDFGDYEFGWGVNQYFNFPTKLIFAYFQAEYMITCNYYENDELMAENRVKGREWLKMIEKVVKETLNVSEIVWNITCSYDDKDENKIRGYIDHQSASTEGRNIQIFESEKILKQFLFNKKSYLQTDNDNK